MNRLASVGEALLSSFSNNDNPSNDNSSGIPETNSQTNSEPLLENSIPRNILAFRTITKLLSQIQREKATQNLDLNLSDKDLDVVKIVNAFSILAVIEHEVVAIVTKASGDPEQCTLELIACIEPSNEVILSSAPTWGSGFWSKVKEYLFSQNPRYAPSPTIQGGEPDISYAACPSDLQLVNDEEILSYIKENRSNPTMSKHLWLLSKLLVMNFSTDKGPERNATLISDHLLPYVIATSYRKMYSRLKNKHVSEPYIQSLSTITTFSYKEPENGRLSKEEINYDRLFLTDYVLHMGMNSPVNIPNILKQAKLAQAKQGFQLYKEDTRLEFHNLFLRLLMLFTESLKNVVDNRYNTDKAKISVLGTKEFGALVKRVKVLGLTLQRLSKGEAFTMHMQTVEPLLWEPTFASISLASISMPFGKEEDDEAKGGEEPKDGEEQNNKEQDDRHDREEATDVLPMTMTVEGQNKPLWKCYVDWLRLMVSHFNAVDDVINFVVGPFFVHKTISVQIVVPPRVDKELLPWRDLFRHPDLFPTETGPLISATFKYADTTNVNLLAFLEKGLINSRRAVRAVKEWKEPSNKQNVIKEFENLESFKIPGWGETAKDMLVELKQCSGAPDADLVKRVSAEIQWLCSLFTSLENRDNKTAFIGTLHCEVILASLLRGIPTSGQDAMKGFGPVIGVSKRCCPVCQHLLFLLGKGPEGPFVIKNSHQTVTACTLPLWLPANYVDAMNKYFGGQLRQELVYLFCSREIGRSRSQSTGSHVQSSDGTIVDFHRSLSEDCTEDCY